MTVQQALDLWPHLWRPACESVAQPRPRILLCRGAGSKSSWMAPRHAAIESISCVHWYGEEFEIDGAVERLKNFLQAVHQKFQLPIWLTEYSLIRWSNPPTYPSWEQQARFASKSIDMLETLPFVKRYAWFSLPPWTKHGSDRTSLYYQDGDLTPVGVAYQKGPIIPPSGHSQAPVASQR